LRSNFLNERKDQSNEITFKALQSMTAAWSIDDIGQIEAPITTLKSCESAGLALAADASRQEAEQASRRNNAIQSILSYNRWS
jgi:hypothetical protein